MKLVFVFQCLLVSGSILDKSAAVGNVCNDSGPALYSVNKVVQGETGDNIQLSWRYRNDIDIYLIRFYTTSKHQSLQIAEWTDNDFDEEKNYTERILFSKHRDVECPEYEQITLTLLNTVAADYNLTYYCNVASRSNSAVNYSETIRLETNESTSTITVSEPTIKKPMISTAVPDTPLYSFSTAVTETPLSSVTSTLTETPLLKEETKLTTPNLMYISVSVLAFFLIAIITARRIKKKV